MGEVFHFDECLITGTDATAFAAFATGVSVDYERDFFNIENESGAIIKRFQQGERASMSIDKLFDAEIDRTDGEAIDVHYGNALGTTSYRLGSAYIENKSWSQGENDAVKHDVKIVGKTFGTI